MINNIKSKEYLKDLLVIKQAIKKGFKVNGIFLTKLSKFSEINNVYKYLKKKFKDDSNY